MMGKLYYECKYDVIRGMCAALYQQCGRPLFGWVQSLQDGPCLLISSSYSGNPQMLFACKDAMGWIFILSFGGIAIQI